MRIHIHSLEKTLYEGEGSVVSLPAEEGEISVLNNHIPLVTSLAKGIVRVREDEIRSKEFSITGGFAQVNKDHIIVLLN